MMTQDYDVVVVLNYYAPYVSGLTETARVVAEGLAARGWRIAVVTTSHEADLSLREVVNDVHVYRAAVLFKIGRGPISPGFPALVRRIAARSRAVHLHLPMLEAGFMAAMLPRIPLVSTYHIDLWLARSLTSQIQITGVNWSARAAIRRSNHVVVNSDDQARHSLLWPSIRSGSWSSIPAPCLDPTGGKPSYRDGNGYHIGFLGRIVPDKGIEYLIQAFRRTCGSDDRLLLGGEYDTVAGGSNIASLRSLADGDTRIRFLGPLRRDQTRDFYSSIDTFALTSVAESFGIVQAEAMMCGLPVVGSDLPGGRVPILETGFGILTQARDVSAIAKALTALRNFSKSERLQMAEKARSLYSAESCIDHYSDLFSKQIGHRVTEPAASRLFAASRPN